VEIRGIQSSAKFFSSKTHGRLQVNSLSPFPGDGADLYGLIGISRLQIGSTSDNIGGRSDGKQSLLNRFGQSALQNCVPVLRLVLNSIRFWSG
jgi:hypothetical protein